MAFAINSPAFGEGAAVPAQFTCDGADLPPPINVSDPPAGTSSFAIIMDDPDAPKGTFTHWLAYDIPASKTELQVVPGRACATASDVMATAGPARRLGMVRTATSSGSTLSTRPRSR